jgi:tRNA nucleotidyltransferase/poly(A) polymerase
LFAALFYNIHTGKVEDHVGGLDDLRQRVLRTPRDPLKTFSDDPLRILRAARFAARFNFKVHESITQAAIVPHIQRDLAQKVSRERMGIEVNKVCSREQLSLPSLPSVSLCSATYSV